MMLLPTLLVVLACAGTPPPAQVTGLAPGDDVVCKTSEDCESDQFCKKPAGQCDAEGACLRRPEVCTANYLPVCGCDGKTHSNKCTAASAGQSVDYEGECTDDD